MPWPQGSWKRRRRRADTTISLVCWSALSPSADREESGVSALRRIFRVEQRRDRVEHDRRVHRLGKNFKLKSLIAGLLHEALYRGLTRKEKDVARREVLLQNHSK